MSDAIQEVCDNLLQLLKTKNESYGNSAFMAPELMPWMPAGSAIFIRMGDKIARLRYLLQSDGKMGRETFDTLYDLAGYCLLAIIAGSEETQEEGKTE